MGWPSRSLKFDTLFFARRTVGFWPVIRPSSSVARSMSFGFCVASPRPMFTTVFTRPGTWWTFE